MINPYLQWTIAILLAPLLLILFILHWIVKLTPFIDRIGEVSVNIALDTWTNVFKKLKKKLRRRT